MHKKYKFLKNFLENVYERADKAFPKCGNHFGSLNYGINKEMEYFKKHNKLSNESN